MAGAFFVVVCCRDAENLEGDIINGFDGFEDPVLEIGVVPDFLLMCEYVCDCIRGRDW